MRLLPIVCLYLCVLCFSSACLLPDVFFYLNFLRLTLSVSSTNCLLVLVHISASCVFLVRVYCLMVSCTCAYFCVMCFSSACLLPDVFFYLNSLRLTLSVSCTNCLLVLVRISACYVFLMCVYYLMFDCVRLLDCFVF